MSATHTTRSTPVESATRFLLEKAKKANDYAIDTTEQVFDFSFKMTDKALDFTSNAIRKGLKVTAAQQELAFGVLNNLKSKVLKK